MLGLNLHWIYAHLIGDYLLQNDWMAGNKKKSDIACMVHIVTYMLPFIFTNLVWWQLLLIAGQHYTQDRTHFVTWFCRVTGKFQLDFNKFWGHVIVDNVIHILWMAVISTVTA